MLGKAGWRRISHSAFVSDRPNAYACKGGLLACLPAPAQGRQRRWQRRWGLRRAASGHGAFARLCKCELNHVRLTQTGRRGSLGPPLVGPAPRRGEAASSPAQLFATGVRAWLCSRRPLPVAAQPRGQCRPLREGCLRPDAACFVRPDQCTDRWATCNLVWLTPTKLPAHATCAGHAIGPFRSTGNINFAITVGHNGQRGQRRRFRAAAPGRAV